MDGVEANYGDDVQILKINSYAERYVAPIVIEYLNRFDSINKYAVLLRNSYSDLSAYKHDWKQNAATATTIQYSVFRRMPENDHFDRKNGQIGLMYDGKWSRHDRMPFPIADVGVYVVLIDEMGFSAKMLLLPVLRERSANSVVVIITSKDEIDERYIKDVRMRTSPKSNKRTASILEEFKIANADDPMMSGIIESIKEKIQSQSSIGEIEIIKVDVNSVKIRFSASGEVNQKDLAAEIHLLKEKLRVALDRLEKQSAHISKLMEQRAKLAAQIVFGDEPEQIVNAAILYADIQGFSTKEENEKRNLTNVMWSASAYVATKEKALAPNTWGDGFVAAFDNPTTALRAAFAMSKILRAMKEVGRFAVTAGDVELAFNPLRNAQDLQGPSVDEASRLETALKQFEDAHVICSYEVGIFLDGEAPDYAFVQRQFKMPKATRNHKEGEICNCFIVYDKSNM